jgi:hypothetical protein
MYADNPRKEHTGVLDKTQQLNKAGGVRGFIRQSGQTVPAA